MKTTFLGTLIIMTVLLSACAPQSYGYSPVTSAPVTSAPVDTSAPAVSGNEAKINISGFAFDPATITIKVGATVTWTNQDSAVHTVAADDNSWTSDNLGNGASFSHTFDTAGTFTYRCGVHPTMKGTVIVQP